MLMAMAEEDHKGIPLPGCGKDVSNPKSSELPDIVRNDIETVETQHRGPKHSTTEVSLYRTSSEQYGKRPECFSSTFQECLFVFTATLAIAQASICVGAVQPITSYIAQTLDMTPAEVTWISASSSYVAAQPFHRTIYTICEVPADYSLS